MPLRIVLVGPPGVGKGTQAELLRDRLGLEHISSGVIFRQEIEAETELGRLAKRYIDEGRLVPNGITIEMMAKRLRKDTVRSRGFILDGYPRNVRQAEALDSDLEEMGLQLDAVAVLSAPEDVVVGRMLGRGRADDNAETIRNRLQVYREETEEVIQHYRGQGKFREVNADQPVEQVYEDLTKGLVT
jgi:adenylate kinase